MQTMTIDILDPEITEHLRELADKKQIAIRDEDDTELNSDRASRPQRKFGWAKGAFVIPDSFDDPIEGFDEGDGIARIPRYFGCGKGEMTILPSFDEPLEEFKEYE